MTVEELEGYFTGIELPSQITLESGVVIMDVPLFLEVHFDYIRRNEGSKSINVYILRLHKAITAIEAMEAVGEESVLVTSETALEEVSEIKNEHLIQSENN